MENRTYSKLMEISKFIDRIKYLQTCGVIGDQTFGGSRRLNQILYTSPEWRSLRRSIILRDEGLDLAHPDHPIFDKILIHHIEPITESDIIHRSEKIFDPENLVSTSFKTHQMIHWGFVKEDVGYKERTPYDTCPWKGE